ncbi:MAG: deoxyribonuclease V [Halobacteriota archaeon]|nr:deoxyribonuclease V [Halobacteriota archaeon]
MRINEDMLRIQENIALKTVTSDQLDRLVVIGGVDQAFYDDKIISGIVLLDYDSLEELESVYTVMDVDFPYIPGFLAFREAPSVIEAFSRLKIKPDMLIVDGCGINHPRFAGLATHVGVELDIPTIGVAKKILCGDFKKEPQEVGEFSEIAYKGRRVGAIFKSKKNCNPIIIAPGHKVSLESSIKIVRHCLKGYKLPEATRLAHQYAGYTKRELLKQKK